MTALTELRHDADLQATVWAVSCDDGETRRYASVWAVSCDDGETRGYASVWAVSCDDGERHGDLQACGR